ncbi:hypothetical protein F441_10960 [Phytophthora nicotianae CJ01A1]|uniref:Uncharacterized protein n=1 Tax=Phytophthora nicotianae CJ01A1 TaxID=1317063 RepID=W2WUP9_PHYNI|nr:hypothetical protein F441_10960 [Phytophthora nicotianae CJ01A1]
MIEMSSVKLMLVQARKWRGIEIPEKILRAIGVKIKEKLVLEPKKHCVYVDDLLVTRTGQNAVDPFFGEPAPLSIKNLDLHTSSRDTCGVGRHNVPGGRCR